MVTPVAEGAAVNNEPAIDVDGYMEGSDGIEVFASQCLPAKLDMQLPEQGVKEKATTVRSRLLADISKARDDKNVELLLKLQSRFYTMEEQNIRAEEVRDAEHPSRRSSRSFGAKSSC